MTKNKFTDSPIFIKLLAFFLASILWFFVAGERQDALGFEVRRSFSDIPITYHNLGEDLAVVEMEETVTLYLQGSPYAFDGLTPADLEAYVDLNGREEGHHELRIQANAPPGLSVVKIEPSKTSVVLEDLTVRQFSIKSEIMGDPADGREVEEILFEPEEVFVRGRNIKVDEVEEVVFRVDVDGARDEVFRTVSLYPVDSEGETVTEVEVNPETVEVVIRFAYPQREVSINPVFTNNGRQVRETIVEPRNTIVKGPKDLLEELEYVETHLIDLAGREDEFTADVPLQLPEGMVSLGEGNAKVTVFLHD